MASKEKDRREKGIYKYFIGTDSNITTLSKERADMVRPRPGISYWSSGEIIHPLQSGTEWGLEIIDYNPFKRYRDLLEVE